MPSDNQISILIQICSNCSQHAWCTRHNQQTYLLIAKQIQASLLSQDSQLNIMISPVGGTKMGSFQIYCNHTLMFSKLKLGYFPHTTSVTTRILSFVEDFKSGKDIQKYDINHGCSPVKSRPENANLNSPTRKPMTASDQMRRTPKMQNKNNQPKKQQPKKVQPKKQQHKKPQIKKQQIKKQQHKKQHKNQQPKKALQTPKKQQSHHKQTQKKQKKQVVVAQTLLKKQQKVQQVEPKKEEKKQQPKPVQHVEQNKHVQQQKQQKVQQHKPEPVKQQQKKVEQAKIQTPHKQQSVQEIKQQPIQQVNQQKPIKIQQQPVDESTKVQAQKQQKKQPIVNQTAKVSKKPHKQQVTIRNSASRVNNQPPTVIKFSDFENEVDKIFKKIDRDTTGLIQKNQFKQLSQWLLGQLDMEVNQQTVKYFLQYFVQIADKNQDGKISFEEFKKICWDCLGDDQTQHQTSNLQTQSK